MNKFEKLYYKLNPPTEKECWGIIWLKCAELIYEYQLKPLGW